MNPTKHVGLTLTVPESDHWQVGSGEATARFGGALNPSGDWTPFKMADEPQSRPTFETFGCAVFATLKAYMMLAKAIGLPFMQDASERYSGVWAGTNQYGTDPHAVAETIRTTAGMIDGKLMPWTDQATLESYYDQAQAQSLLPVGQELLNDAEFGHEWIFGLGSGLTPKQKQVALQAALERGTVCVTLDGDYRYKQGRLTKPAGGADSHFAVLLKHDGKHGTIHDQYAPFVKELDANYDHQAAKLYFLQKRTAPSSSFWSQIINAFTRLWSR